MIGQNRQTDSEGKKKQTETENVYKVCNGSVDRCSKEHELGQADRQQSGWESQYTKEHPVG